MRVCKRVAALSLHMCTYHQLCGSHCALPCPVDRRELRPPLCRALGAGSQAFPHTHVLTDSCPGPLQDGTLRLWEFNRGCELCCCPLASLREPKDTSEHQVCLARWGIMLSLLEGEPGSA